jgi:hypothetical protein
VRVEPALKTPIPDRLLHNKRPSKKSSSSNFMSAPAPPSSMLKASAV